MLQIHSLVSAIARIIQKAVLQRAHLQTLFIRYGADCLFADLICSDRLTGPDWLPATVPPNWCELSLEHVQKNT